MTEQNLDNSIDTQSTLNPLETHHVNSSINHSASSKLNVPTVTSLPVSSMEAITQIITPTPIDEDDIKKGAGLNDSDNDSFDDEDEIVLPNTFHPTLSPTSSDYGLMSCPICYESSILQSLSCCKFRCCDSCWRSHISAAINDGRIKISCASNECNKYLPRETIVNFIRYDSTLQERYLRLYTNMNQNPRAKTCPRCSHLYSLDTNRPIELKNSKKSNKKLPKQVQCSECSFVWCFRCSAPWHENLTCKQFLKGDKLLLKWINQKNDEQWNARKCPKCSSVIQRAGGCPHMTCSSCSCEFCYLCGRRYINIPIIGQHSNKFSMLGCPYNLHPEKPWLRRTIRGVIATGVVVASPLIVAGALTAAVTVLPTVGVIKLVRHVRERRHIYAARAFVPDQVLLGLDHEQQEQQQLGLFQFELNREDVNAEEILQLLRQYVTQTNEEDLPVPIFADMDVENLFSDDNKPRSDFQTCPTTPALNNRNDHGEILDDLTINQQHLTTEEH